MMSLITWTSLFALILITLESISSQDKCQEGNECLPISQCNPQYLKNILFPCHSGLHLYCCPPKIKSDGTVTNLLARRKDLFPKDCGISFTDNKITGGESANLGQFPWMALLGYKQRRIDFVEFICGGTLITETYILTAAHCLAEDKNRELVTVRVGEHNLRSEKDCTVTSGIEYCSDKPVDLAVNLYMQHPNYDSVTLKNDIGLVKVKSAILFTDYVQPICLPFERNLERIDLTGQKFTISGWGKTDSRKVGGSSLLQFAFVNIWDQTNCNNVVPPEVHPISDTQLCANGRKEDACKGDSGGPLFNASVDTDGQLRNFQLGIVSFASTLTCGIEELPSIYTRVDRYLNWIVDNIK